jgi:hypothetical protein
MTIWEGAEPCQRNHVEVDSDQAFREQLGSPATVAPQHTYPFVQF